MPQKLAPNSNLYKQLMEQEYLSTRQASLIVGCSPEQVRYLVRKGTLPAEKQFTPEGKFVGHLIKPEAARQERDNPAHARSSRGKARGY